MSDVRATTPRARAIQAAFTGTPPPARLQTLVDEGKLGEALLRALALFDAGADGDLRSVTDALALLRAVGLEDVARRAALQLMILDRSA
jgi:2-methylisocitrate lyase-like PEP mutase family enzyme